VVKNALWTKAIRNSADPARARHYLDLLAETNASEFLKRASAEQARILSALFSGSQALGDWLVANPDTISSLTPELLSHPRRESGMRREVAALLESKAPAGDTNSTLAVVRLFKQREMLRVAARDLARLANAVEITRELSEVADVCLSGVWNACLRQLSGRFGRPYHQDADGRWEPTPACVFGMGKLGGQELNYSSDVDVIFVYAEEGQCFSTAPGKGKTGSGGLTNHQFFNRLAEMFIAEVGRMTGQGTMYRIDLRLRPEGDAGPLTRSLAGYENYYAQWGQTWERMMLIKARCVAGDPSLGAEFLELVQPFRYPRSLGAGVAREVTALKDRIESEVVKSGELDRNVKLGRGGIREIEFIAQTLQLLHAGRQPFLQGAQTLPTLAKLVQYHLMTDDEAKALTDAYVFLRDVEHRLQMEHNLQTHSIPQSPEARKRLAALMEFATLQKFEAALKAHTQSVRRVYDKLLKSDAPQPAASLPKDIAGEDSAWKEILAAHSFRDAQKAVRLLHEFAYGPGYGHVSNRTVELALGLLPKFLALCPKVAEKRPTFDPNSRVLSDPDRVLTRLDSFVSAYGARATLFETWTSNPSLFELLLLLFDRSEFLAEVAIRTPDLVDELVLSGRLRRRKEAAEILTDLQHGRNDEDQRLWLRRYHQAELMRIGLRDILGLADFEQNLTELSGLADACLQYALETVLRRHKLKKLPLVIIGLGKLGGAELNYGSDLDILFVTDSPVAKLPSLQRVAIEMLELLSSPTEFGVAFDVDTRLRPDGEKGLLVNTLDAHEEYYRRRAQLWEIQAITRTRPVAGNLELGRRFQDLARSLTDFSTANVAKQKFGAKPTATSGLAAYNPKWKAEIHRMRQRIEKERTPKGQDELAIKTGKGGLMDAEFIAQALAMGHGWQEANTLHALELARETKAIPRMEAGGLIEHYRQLRRVEGILRRWSYEGEAVLPDDPAPFYRVSVRCGFATPEAFRKALAEWRGSIRAAYKNVFSD
jgi:glutamate-ammonia-ligase adenylyltransferase